MQIEMVIHLKSSLILNFIFSLPLAIKLVIKLGLDASILFFCFALAVLLRLDVGAIHRWDDFLAIFAPILPVSMLVFYLLGSYSSIIRFISLDGLRIIVFGSLISSLLLFASAQLQQVPTPRSIPIIYFFLGVLGLSAFRFFVRMMGRLSVANSRQKVVVVGAGSAGRQTLSALLQNNQYAPLFFVDDDIKIQNLNINGLKILSMENAHAQLKNLREFLVVIAIPSVSRSRKRALIEAFSEFDCEVRLVPGLDDLLGGKIEFAELKKVTADDLLGRDPVTPDEALMGSFLNGNNILVTGAGGSIGSELCRQILKHKPQKLVLLDVSEPSLYQIDEELRLLNTKVGIYAVLCSIQHEKRLLKTLQSFEIDIVFHAAAYKHVPLLEQNVVEAMRNNVFGTRVLVDQAIQAGVKNFVLVSTDKAVRPTNYMGASKRLAEMICQARASSGAGTIFSMVRFGNVLGSSGSVIPKFEAQIQAGGPVTVTHEEITRFFMSIPEAAQLVIQAGAMSKGGEVFVLDMGEPVKIIDLARNLVRLRGLVPFSSRDEEPGDIEIRVTGLRPGEKLYEELLIGDDAQPTAHPRIRKAQEAFLDDEQLGPLLEKLLLTVKDFDIEQIREILLSLNIGFKPDHDINDHIHITTKTKSLS